MVAKVVPILTAREAKELWKNARGSILHALEHFAELSAKGSDQDHHTKWIVLSVHHAAELVCNTLLKQFDLENPLFKKKDGDWFPTLKQATQQLLAPMNLSRLTDSEVRLLGLLEKLKDSRDRIMHRLVPQNIDVSLSAVSILGISRVAHRRRGESVEDILQQDPPIQRGVVDAIRHENFDEYYRFVEVFLAEEFPDQYLATCENCGINSIVKNRCEACFQSVDSFACDSCNEEILLPESWRLQGQSEVVCPSCGKKISV